MKYATVLVMLLMGIPALATAVGEFSFRPMDDKGQDRKPFYQSAGSHPEYRGQGEQPTGGYRLPPAVPEIQKPDRPVYPPAAPVQQPAGGYSFRQEEPQQEGRYSYSKPIAGQQSAGDYRFRQQPAGRYGDSISHAQGSAGGYGSPPPQGAPSAPLYSGQATEQGGVVYRGYQFRSEMDDNAGVRPGPLPEKPASIQAPVPAQGYYYSNTQQNSPEFRPIDPAPGQVRETGRTPHSYGNPPDPLGPGSGLSTSRNPPDYGFRPFGMRPPPIPPAW